VGRKKSEPLELEEPLSDPDEVEETFRQISGEDAQGYRIYIYRREPPPKHGTGPGYIERLEWPLPSNDDIVEHIARKYGAGLYELLLKCKNEIRGKIKVVISEDSPLAADVQPLGVTGGATGQPPDVGLHAQLTTIIDRLARLEERRSAPASLFGGLDLQGLLTVLQTAKTLFSSSGGGSTEDMIKLFMNGLETGRTLETGDGTGALLGKLADAIPSIAKVYALQGINDARTDASSGGARPPIQSRTDRAISGGANAGGREDRTEATTPPASASPALPSPSLGSPLGGEDMLPASSVAITDEGSGSFDLVTEIDSHINKNGDPDFSALFVLQYAAPGVADAITPAAIAAIQEDVKDNPQFPGFNSEHAGKWLGEFLERLTFHQLSNSLEGEEATTVASS
jgi:hypothetical protein